MNILEKIEEYLSRTSLNEGKVDAILKAAEKQLSGKGSVSSTDKKVTFKAGKSTITVSFTGGSIVVTGKEGSKQVYKSGKMGNVDTVGNAIDSAMSMVKA